MISISHVGLNKFIRANNNNNDNNVCSEILKVEGPFIVTIYFTPPINKICICEQRAEGPVFCEGFFTPG